jgi:Mn-dependent DtxR family transcriptional regulator
VWRAQAAADPLESVPMRLTYRTSRVLEGVAELAGRGSEPSNREVADFAGIHDPGQVSKLLRRLERLGLLSNSGLGHAKGEPNAWRLTPKGELVARSIRAHSRSESEAA